MKKFTFILLMACGHLVHAAPALSAKETTAAAELAKGNEKIVGPAYSKIAAKYSDDKDATASLAQSIRNGSSGKWGRIPMPAHGNMSQEDINLLARWVLTIKGN
jgi:cytochrome c